MLKIMWISVDADIRSNCTRDGLDVNFLIFVDEDIGADTHFQYLQMRMLEIMRMPMWISGPPLVVSAAAVVV